MRTLLRLGVLGALLAAGAEEAVAQSGGSQAPAPPAQTSPDEAIRFRLPTITVTAQKETENIQDSPVSVTAVTDETLERAGVRTIAEAAQYAPNTFLNEFSAR